MPLTVRIQSAEAERHARDLRGRWSNYRLALQGPVKGLLRDFFEEQFRTEGAYGGHPWAELTDTTISIKARLGVANKGILRRFDKLYDALTSEGARGQRFRVSKTGMQFEITVPYAWRHQVGAIKGGTARIILPPEMPQAFMVGLRNLIRGYSLTGRIRH